MVHITTNPTLLGIPTYNGEWTTTQASHLLRRTGFGLRPEEVAQLARMNMEEAVDLLLEERPLPSQPVNYNFEDDPNVAVGEVWIGKPLIAGVNVNQYRLQSLRSWVYDNIRKERLSVRERMCEFWVNHFGIAGGGQAQVRYDFHILLKEFALGNFKELMKRVTIDKAMLVFLNGNLSYAASPNENYARELLELFTVGKGPQIAPGDYSNYTEQDVRALARALTGWETQRLFSTNPSHTPESVFNPGRHDISDKELSYHFNGDILSDGGINEYKQVIDRIFEQPAVARFICRKLYRHFVYYKVSDAVEAEIIEGLAQILEENDFEIRPVLRALFLSDHFYSTDYLGPMIKNPLQLVAGKMRTFNHDHQFEELKIDQKRRLFIYYYYRAAAMDMDYFNPPSVAGWEAYYQQPGFYRIWINSSTLQERTRFAQTMTSNNGVGLGENGFGNYDYLKWIEQIEDATDPVKLIKGIVELLLPIPLTEEQLTVLKEALIPGLPDFEWTVEYGNYLAAPSNRDIASSVAAKLRSLFRSVFGLAEFQLV